MDKKQFWLSFADDEGFLGGLCVYAEDENDALRISHRMKINPGGHVLISVLPDNVFITDEFCNRLLNKEESYNCAIYHKH